MLIHCTCTRTDTYAHIDILYADTNIQGGWMKQFIPNNISVTYLQNRFRSYLYTFPSILT